MQLQCITLHAQWAEAVFALGKDVENRAWSTPYRGTLAIHAGLQFEPDRCLALGFNPETLARGVILGTVELVDVVRDSPSKWARAGQYHWLLRNPVRLPSPIRCRGQQKIYTVTI